MRKLYTREFPRPRIAGYAQLVGQAAEEGDEVAKEILESGARQLVLIANAVRRELFQPSENVLMTSEECSAARLCSNTSALFRKRRA